VNQQQVEQERERLRIALSLKFSRSARSVMVEHADSGGMPPVNDPEYLAKLRMAVEDYARNLELLGGVG